MGISLHVLNKDFKNNHNNSCASVPAENMNKYKYLFLKKFPAPKRRFMNYTILRTSASLKDVAKNNFAIQNKKDFVGVNVDHLNVM